MNAVIDFINNHVRDIFIPLTALALLRIGLCAAQLKRTAQLREKKGVYHAVQGHYTEIGVWVGALPGLLLPVFVPRLWLVGLVVLLIGGAIGRRVGVKKGAALDDIYRQVATELKQEAEAEAAREEASHTLEGHENEIRNDTERMENRTEAPESGEAGVNAANDTNETTENKGETENG